MSTPEPQPSSQTLPAPPSVPPSDQTAYQATPSASAVNPTAEVNPTAGRPDAAPTDHRAVEPVTGEGGTMAQAAPSAAAMSAAPKVVRIPGYEILGELGRGGMGVVFKARQLGLNRLVAIKMILSGDYADSGDLARFRLEAEAVAKLQHPNIVQVYAIDEAGGKPYFCLEFVNGGPLQKQLGGNPQPPRQAAHMIEQLADAMDYAHRNHIIHRDLKPANVLLTETGVPKVADFGLAKRLDEEASHQTQSGSILGTPSYMAPEQAHGNTRDTGPGGDIYSLGAILYEMLVGRPPFKGATVLDTLEMVRSQEPVAPSRMQSKLPRDLETICLKCLQKDPKNRYLTAGALAEDLRRFQVHEPIFARPTPAWERAWKWTRRRPLAAALVAVSVLFALSLAVGGVAFGEFQRSRAEKEKELKGQAVTAQERAVKAAEKEKELKGQAVMAQERAEKNFESARSAVDAMLTTVGQQTLAYEPHMEKIRRDLLKKALDFQEGFLKEKGDDAEIQDETGRAYARVGDIQEMLGDHDAAEQAYDAGRTILAKLNSQFPDDKRYRRDLATCVNNLGQLLKNAGRTPEAEQALREALDLRRKLTDEQGNADDRLELANVADNLGGLLLNEDRYAEAETLLQQSVGLLEKLAGESPDNPMYQQNLARGRNNLGLLLSATGRPGEAEQAFRQALDILQQLKKQHPDAPEYRQELAVSYDHLGNLWRDTSPAKAEEFYRESLNLRTHLVADFPTTPVYRQEQAASYHNLALSVQAAGHSDEAEENYHLALAIEQKLANDYPSMPDYSLDLAGSRFNLGILLQTAHRLPEAEVEYGKALALLETLTTKHPDAPAYQQKLAGVERNLGVLYQKTNRPDQAEKALNRTIEIRRQLVKRFPKAPIYQEGLAAGQFNLGTIWHINGKLSEAEARYREAVAGFTELANKLPAAPDYRHQLADALKNLGTLLQATNRPQEAEKDLRTAADLLRRLKDEQPGVPVYRLELARVLNDLAMFLASHNGADEAEKVWGEALSLVNQLAKDFPKDAVYKQEAATYNSNLGVLYGQKGRLVQSEQSYRKAVAQLEELVKANPNVPVYWQDLIDPYTNLINLITVAGAQPEEIEKNWRRLVELRRQLAKAYPKTAKLQSDLGLSLGDFASRLRTDGKNTEARQLLEEAVRCQRTALDLSPGNAVYSQRLASQTAEMEKNRQ